VNQMIRSRLRVW